MSGISGHTSAPSPAQVLAELLSCDRDALNQALSAVSSGALNPPGIALLGSIHRIQAQQALGLTRPRLSPFAY